MSLSMIISKSIHIAANGVIQFFFMAEQYSILPIYHIFILHSSADGHLGCFHVLDIVNSAVMSIGVHVSFRIIVLSGSMPSCGIVLSYGNSISFFFMEYSFCSPYWLYQFTLTVQEGSLFSTPFPVIVICKFFNDGHSDWRAFLVVMIKNPPADPGDIRDMDSIPGQGRSPGEGHINPLQYSSPWTEKPGGLNTQHTFYRCEMVPCSFDLQFSNNQ